MYVVLEGSALSNGALDTVNPAAEGQFHVLGEIELTSSPDLEPALTVDGANDLDDLCSRPARWCLSSTSPARRGSSAR